MNDVDKNIERLIARSLDGEITDDEQLALNRELIRNPEANRLMEEYLRMDALTAAALRDVMDVDALPLDPDLLPDRPAWKPTHRHRNHWWLIGGAVAAALLAAVTARLTAPVEHAGMQTHRNTVPIPQVAQRSQPDDDIMRHTSMNANPRVQRSAGKDVFGVMGDDGTLYWIEVDRVWTLKRAQPGSVAGRSRNEL